VEKPFVIRWNIIGFAGGGAFLLSVLLGAFSGNLFLPILFKACIFGVVFALLAGGITIVIERFIPQIAGADADSPEEERKGKNVDILLHEDRESEGDIEELADDDDRREPEPVSRPRRFAGNALGESEPLDDLSADAEGAAEEPDHEATSDEEPFADASEPEVNGEPGEATLMEEKERPPVSAAKASGKAGEEGDIDVLPDMSHFESSFAPVTSGGLVNDSDSFDTFGSDSLKQKSMDGDPATYAKAMRTIIRRDEGKK